MTPTLDPNLLVFGLPGGMEVVLILVVVLLLFGGRIPGVARSLGKGIIEFKRGLKEPPEEEQDEPKANLQEPSSTKRESP